MKTAPADVAGFQEILERKQAEMARMLRKRDNIAVEKSADQMDEVPSRLSRIRALTGQLPGFLNTSNVDIVSVQHEFGISGRPAGSHLLALLRELKAPMIQNTVSSIQWAGVAASITCSQHHLMKQNRDNTQQDRSMVANN